MKLTARCLTSSDDAMIAWSADQQLPGLRGFALRRKRNGKNEVVSTWVGFAGEQVPPGTRKESTVWPIQKFFWTDFVVRSGDRVSYQVVPMVGQAGQLTAREDLASAWTPTHVVGGSPSKDARAFFNRGIVASQWLSRWLQDEAPGVALSKSLRTAIETVGDPIRAFLSGSVRTELVARLQKAVDSPGVKIYAALYELEDEELEDALLRLGMRANVVLANGSVKSAGMDQNLRAREKLDGHVNLYDRMVSPSALGHNKFCVFTDSQGAPASVWTGSTNWTRTGLCTQANNALLIDAPDVAAEFFQQWNLLRNAGNGFPAELVAANDDPRRFEIGSSRLTLWFTRTSDEQDLAEARKLIEGAKQGLLFLMFNPGPSGTLLNSIIERGSISSSHYDPSLYISGVLNQDPGTAANPVTLFHRGRADHAAFDTVLPEAIDERFAFWVAELKKLPSTFAMVHSKVVVIDPFGDHPAVITGSHNLGPKASSKNDENMVIVRGDKSLAATYAVNIAAIYAHYRWRYYLAQSHAAKAFQGLADDDKWQKGYFEGERAREIRFWMGAT